MRSLVLPPSAGDIGELVAGDEVSLEGPALTLRDAALGRLRELVERGERPPFDLDGQLVFHAGPTPPAAGRPAGAIGPTTSARMDGFLPVLFELGVRATLGKGPRSPEAVELHARYGAVYLVATGGIAALHGGAVESIEVLAWEELGTEAVHRVVLSAFPALVAIDARGTDHLREQYRLYRTQK